MGISKFFRYTSERYPCLNELVIQNEVPDFDNMYLDMNNIIHICTHTDSGVSYEITEENIFESILHYISVLFQIIKPKKLFFMAIDGVAPRAKINQQRAGSFCAAREAVEMQELVRDEGASLSTEKHFASICISPGTVFMARLYKRMQFFVKQKITMDPLWAGCKVLLSGHETPGEGEHKIMEYIRWARSQEGYDPNTRHCLYGLDADLIILAMCTHDPHFALLREEVLFSVNVEQQTRPEEINFFLLHISLMREYLEQEFIGLKEILPFEYDLEKILDDWVLMSLLLGNDFIPNLPNLHILQNDALPVLYKTYIKVLPLLDGYINEAGDLHLGRFEVFMQELANLDKKAFLDNSADIQLLGTTRQQPNENVRTEMMEEDKKEDDVDINEVDTFNREFVLHKRDYYMNKLRYPKVTKEVLKSQAECYVRAIQWNLHYYYRGCVSWSWYYPHHYAPYMSDIKGFKDMKLQYDLGTPFKPFEQLLAVLPSQSRELLPAPFHRLMIDEESPILQYYSLDFETDLNGKKNDWEAVVLLPPIDENLLLSAMEPCYAELSAEERQLNTHGPMLMYTYTKEVLEEVAPLSNSHALEKAIWREELHVSEQNLKRGRLPNALSHLFFPGVPTLRHFRYHSRIEVRRPGQTCCVKVFNQPSRHDNMIIMLESQGGWATDKPCLELVAQELLGRVVWVGWPYLSQAKVISVSNQQLLYRYTPDDESTDSVVNVSANRNVTKESTPGMEKQFSLQKNYILQHTMGRMGIDVGEVDIIVHAVNLRGHKYVMEKNAAFVVKPEWCVEPCGYALQAVVQALAVHSIPALTKYNSVQEAFTLDGLVFVMTREYYGCQAKVISSSAVVQKGYIEVLVSEDTEPSTTPSVISEPNTTYMTEYQVADRCGLSPQLVTRITGKIFVIDGDDSGSFYGSNRTFIGLDLKFHQQNREVIGYTRKINNKWLYSERCLELLGSYIDRFPDMFNRMSTHQNINKMFEYDLWPDQVGAGKPKEVVAWLKQQAHTLADQRESPSVGLEEEELASLAVSVDTQLPHLDHDKRVPLQVKIHLLYMPDLHEGSLPPDPEADFQLYDRVVNVNNTIEVPLGAKGTITAIFCLRTVNSVHLSDNLNVETSYQVLFDTAFSGGDEKDGVEGTRFYRLNASSLLNISYGRNLRDTTNKQTAKQHADDKSKYLQTEYLNWLKEYNNQHDQLTQNHRQQSYQNNQYQKKQQSNWRSRVLETDEGHNSASPTEKNQCNQNKVQPIQNPRTESTNIGQCNNKNVAPSSDNMASASDSSQSKNSETGSDQHKILVKNKSSPVKVSLKPAKVLSNNWRRDSEEHQRIQPPLSTVTHPLHPSTLTQNPLPPPSHLSSMSQPPLTHQTSYQYRRPPVYQPMQQLGRMGLGSVANAFLVQPNIPNNRTRTDTKKKTKHGKGSRTPE